VKIFWLWCILRKCAGVNTSVLLKRRFFLAHIKWDKINFKVDSVEITNKMQPCNRIYYSTVQWRLNIFRAAYRSSSGGLTVFAASGLHTHVVTGRSQVWVGTQFWVYIRMWWQALVKSEWELSSEFPLRLDYGRSPHAYVNQRLQIQLELLMMSGMPLETCWAFNERWNNKFCYNVASCWLFLLN